MNKNKNYSRLFITNHASKRKVEWNTENIESVEKYYWPRILFTTEVFFSAEGEIKTFSEKKKKKNFSEKQKLRFHRQIFPTSKDQRCLKGKEKSLETLIFINKGVI